jgi:hypothetical protein
VNYGESQAFLKRIKVSIAMEQSMPFSETKGGNETVHRLANGMASPPEGSKISRRSDGKFSAAAGEYFAVAEFRKHHVESAIVEDALQHFAENDINQPETLAFKLRIQPFDLGIVHAAKIVDPNRRINDDHDCYSGMRP